MRSVEEHREELLSLVDPLGAEQVPTGEAMGRTLAGAVTSPTDLPPFDNTSMDGYAVRSGEGSPGVWRVSQDVAAGVAPAPLEPGTVARIMTGAPMPQGADAVVQVELTDSGAHAVQIHEWPASGQFVRRRGSDVRAGDPVLQAGTVMGPLDVAAAAACGVASVDVVRPARVAIVTTGDELVAPGEPLPHGAIYDANATSLPALAQAWGAHVVSVRAIADDEAALVHHLAGLDADLIITAGGVSQGAYDVVKSALATRGITFGQVAMQPGKPQGWGLWGGIPVVCVPGNPVSAVVTFAAFIAPMLCVMHRRPAPVAQTAVAGEGWTTPPGRAQFMPVVWRDGRVVPATPGGSGSHLIASLSHAKALAVVGRDVERVEPGDTVGIMRFLP